MTVALIDIRPFTIDDAAQVRDLFVRVNRLLAPPHLKEAFETYIANSLREEIDRIGDYYGGSGGGFWIATEGRKIVGMFGLEPSSTQAMELRRMYVDPGARRRGFARQMLKFAEDECVRRQRPKMHLSTSELQGEALLLYRNCGYRLLREEVAIAASNRSLGGGIRRLHFTKPLLSDRNIPEQEGSRLPAHPASRIVIASGRRHRVLALLLGTCRSTTAADGGDKPHPLAIDHTCA